MTKPLLDFETAVNELESAGLHPRVLRTDTKRSNATHVCIDTRKITPDAIFCATKGANIDSHTLISTLKISPAFIIIQTGLHPIPDIFTHSSIDFNSCGVIEVSSTRAAWAQLASFFSGHPSKKLKMIGITGTNGKTSTVWMIRSMLEGLGLQAASIGTLGFIDNNSRVESSHTTPDPDVLYPKLKEWAAAGVTHVIMEISSHSLIQGKVHPIKFETTAFTSFSQDHLDFHPTMEDYLDAKLSLFKFHLSLNALVLMHKSVLELPLTQKLISHLKLNAYSYSIPSEFDRVVSMHQHYNVICKSFYSLGLAKIRLTQDSNLSAADFVVPIVGDVFSENFAAAAIICASTTGLSIFEISTRLRAWKIPPVSGRLELVDSHLNPWRPLVYVDYAHTPDALEKAIINLSASPNSVITVFGCGGDRDKTKRPIMGTIAAKLSKQVVITSDNPRTEDPEKICGDIFAGIESTATHVTKVLDRQKAIETAITPASGKDVILIAGKGHENYQIIGHNKIHFSDQEISLKELQQTRTWLVFGAGMSGFAAANHLVKYGDHVVISDDVPITSSENLNSHVSIVRSEDIPWDQIKKVLVSPGIPLTHEIVKQAKKLNLEIITEIDLGFNNYQGTVLAVTGTNGKSTTVAMVEFLLNGSGKPATACGNIGLPPSALNLREAPSSHISVVELSSYQLEASSACPALGAAITSFSFDHIARHKTMEAYFDAKWKIAQWLDREGVFVVSLDVAGFANKVNATWPQCEIIVLGIGFQPKFVDDLIAKNARQSWHYLDLSNLNAFSQSHPRFPGLNSVNFEQINIQGIHNQINAVAASLLAEKCSSKPLTDLIGSLSEYKVLPYRCEIVFKDSQKCVVNDSKSTNLESTIAALSIAKRPAILLMGGQGKGEPYHDLLNFRHQISQLICFGASGPDIAKEAEGLANISIYPKMKDATINALRLSQDLGCDVIFSPGCASFDEFKNFEHRGKIFNELVQEFFSGGFS